MTRRALAVVAVLATAGCGVNAQDRPQPIEETSIQQPPAPPSIDTELAPTTTATTATSTASSSRVTSPPPVTRPSRWPQG